MPPTEWPRTSTDDSGRCSSWYVAHVFRRSFSSQGSSAPVSTFVLGLMPARAHSSWKRAFGRAPPPRKTGASGLAFSGRILPEVRVYDVVHRPVEALVRLHPSVEQPSPP